MGAESLGQKLAGIHQLTVDRINQMTQDRSQAEGDNVPNARRSMRQQKRDRRHAAQEVLLQAEAANQPLISCTEGTLIALGYRRHHRDEWRLKQVETGFHQLWTEVNEMDKPRENLRTVHSSGPAENDTPAIGMDKPVVKLRTIHFSAPAGNDSEAIDSFTCSNTRRAQPDLPTGPAGNDSETIDSFTNTNTRRAQPDLPTDPAGNDLAAIDSFTCSNTRRAQPDLPTAPADNDAAAIDTFTRAKAGDAEAMARVRELIKDRKSLEWLNQLGKLSTQRLLTHVPDRDSKWKALLESHVHELYTEMLGENPSILEQLLVRRVINDWIAVNALELELASKNALNYSSRGDLDKAMTLAHKRYTQAINELMRVRRLQETRLLAQITSVTRVTTRNSTNATAKEVGPDNEG